MYVCVRVCASRKSRLGSASEDESTGDSGAACMFVCTYVCRTCMCVEHACVYPGLFACIMCDVMQGGGAVRARVCVCVCVFARARVCGEVGVEI